MQHEIVASRYLSNTVGGASIHRIDKLFPLKPSLVAMKYGERAKELKHSA